MLDLGLMRRGAIALSVTALLAAAPAAMASGGVNSGGVNSGGVNAGGGGGGGGTTTPTPAPSGSCAQITQLANTNGYYAIWAAIWTTFKISSTCTQPVSWTMTYTNGTTGLVDFQVGTQVAYESSGTVDEDWAAFSTDYTVTLTVQDSSGNVLASQSALVTTKKPKGTGGA